MLFVMGATGRMGGAVLRHAAGPARAATRSGAPFEGAEQTVRFDLDDPETHAAALSGCDAMFVMRPPSSVARAPFDRLMQVARASGIRHVVCASVYGAGQTRLLPHRHMEAAVRASEVPWTFLRPADFMQNLADVHGARIRQDGMIRVPAGHGRSAFVDVEDIGKACAAVLQFPDRHAHKAYDLTGPEALGFDEVARILSRVLNRRVSYDPVSVPRFVWDETRRGTPVSMAIVMAALYTVQRLGRAAPVCPDLDALIGPARGDLAGFVARERAAFLP